MRDDLLKDVLDRLRAYEFKERGDWLREGKCPQCAKRSLWTHGSSPWVLRCSRLNRCGWEGHVKELFPDLFESWSDRYKQTETNPDAAADAYLHHARGLNITGLRGAYVQEQYFDRERNEGTATARFPIHDWGAPGEPVVSWWERLIDRPWRFGDKKARFQWRASYGGLWWAHPEDTPSVLAAAPEVWVVEGIFDAISLRQAGVAAVAAMSSGNYPETALARLREAVAQRRRTSPTLPAPRLVFALDSDAAGRRGIRKMVERAREQWADVGAAQIPQPTRGKVDWNDLHLRDRLKAADLDDYRWRGALLLAANAPDKALLLHDRNGQRTFPFDFGSRLYWATIGVEALEAATKRLTEQGDLNPDEVKREATREALRISSIANCNPRPLYFQQDPLTDESWYFYKVEFPHDGPTVKNTFTPAQIAGAAEFKKRLLGIAPLATFTGNSTQLDRLLDQQSERLRVVEAIGFVGYSREHEAYVFNDVAVKNGRLFELNEDDYFDLKPHSVKSVDRSVGLDITPWTDKPDLAWADHLYNAFGPKGLVALVYWFGSLYAEQLRAKHASFPFLELSGEPNSGKTTLIEFLWKLCGRQGYEGFDPSKSSMSGRTRTFAQVGNLPVVLMEGDRDEDTARGRKFDFDELKPLYNGRSTRTTGVKNGGNETREPPFRGAIVIEQNRAVDASDAMLQRIVRLHFDGDGYGPATKAAADRLEGCGIEQVSGFILAAAQAEAKVLARVAETFAVYEQSLMEAPRIAHRRIAKCHAQLLALLDALTLILPLPATRREEAERLIVRMAEDRKLSIASDHPVVEQFWEAFDYIGSRYQDDYERNRLDHARADGLIAVNLNDFASKAADLKVPVPDNASLKAHLRSSKVRKFVAARDVNSVQTSKTLHCWVFQAPADRAAHTLRPTTTLEEMFPQ